MYCCSCMTLPRFYGRMVLLSEVVSCWRELSCLWLVNSTSRSCTMPPLSPSSPETSKQRYQSEHTYIHVTGIREELGIVLCTREQWKFLTSICDSTSLTQLLRLLFFMQSFPQTFLCWVTAPRPKEMWFIGCSISAPWQGIGCTTF